MTGQERGGQDSGRRRRGLFERVLFSFMGPPQLGSGAPSTYVPDPAAQLCHKCGRPWTEHEVVRTGSMTYATCPARPVAEDPAPPDADG